VTKLKPARSQQEFELARPRREFLSRLGQSAIAGAATIAFVSSASKAVAGSTRRIRLSTSTVHFRTLSFEEACQRIAAIGFEGVDIWSQRFQCPHLDEIEKTLGPEKAKEILAKYNLKPYAVTCYYEGYPRYAKLLHQIGGRVAVRESIYGKISPNAIVPTFKKLFEDLKPDIDLAEQYDAFIAIENHADALLDSLDSFKAFVDLNPSKRIGIALAPYHLQHSGVRVEDAITICGDQLKFFYAWQAGEKLQPLPGHGPTDFAPWLTALAKENYAWYVNPFTHHHVEPDKMSKALAKSVDYLRKC
jgi:sugar phosphate isomerase/epimerase